MAQQFHHNIQLHYNWQGISLVACPKEIHDFLGNLLFFSWGVQHHSSRYKLFPFTTVRKWMLRSFTVCAFYCPCPIISDMIIFLPFAFHDSTQARTASADHPLYWFFYWGHIRSCDCRWDLMSVESPLRDQSRPDNHLANIHPNPKLSPQVAQAFKPNLALNVSSNISLLGSASLSSRAGSSFLYSTDTVVKELLLEPSTSSGRSGKCLKKCALLMSLFYSILTNVILKNFTMTRT